MLTRGSSERLTLLEKSVPYLRLENSKSTSKCQVSFTVHKKTQTLDRIGAPGTKQAPGALKEGLFQVFQHFCCKTSKKLKWVPLGNIYFSKNAEKY